MLGYCVIAASLVILIFLYMLYKNNEERHQRLAAEAKEQQKQLEELKAEQEELKELGVGENNLRSEDLDFWEMYEPEKKKEPEKEEEEFVPEKPPVTPLPTRPPKTENTDNAENYPEDPGEAVRPQDDATVNELSDDDRHIGITDPDGRTIYYEIMDNVPRNEYTMASSLSMKNGRLTYNDGDIRSLNGVVVNKNQGMIDWTRVRADGTDFAMVKVAYRGYDSGIISLDTNFVVNARGAVENGIAVGTYFSTQAISEAEAIEEANFTVGAISQYGITYPVAIYIENIKNDTARTDALTMDERTAYVKAYLDTVKSFGFTPMIYADMNTLIKDLDLSKLKGYSIFLSDPVDYTLAKELGMSTEPAPKLLPTPVPTQVPSYAVPSLYPASSSSVTGQTSSASYNVSAMAQKKQTSSTAEKDSSAVRTGEERESAEQEAGEPAAREKKWYTEFPYRFSIWQYNQTGEVDGINGSVPLTIGFVDYSQR